MFIIASTTKIIIIKKR